MLRRGVLHLRRETPVRPDALLPLDAILLSHLHHDHLDLPSLAALGRNTTLVVPRGGGRLLRRRGFAAVDEVEPGSLFDIGPVRVSVTPAEHDARRFKVGRDVPAVGYVLEAATRVYFAGDTDFFPAMRDLTGLDVALVPISGWGRGLGGGHLDPERAADAVALMRPRVAVPIHWGTYRMLGHEGRKGDLDAFVRAAAERAPDVEVRVLAQGETVEV